MMDGSRIDIWHVRIVRRGLVTTATTTVVLVTLGTRHAPHHIGAETLIMTQDCNLVEA